MFKLTKGSDLGELRFYIYDFLNRYGFNDSDSILEEEKEIIEHLCHRLARAIGVVDNRWEPLVAQKTGFQHE